jgi:hypothetical protein
MRLKAALLFSLLALGTAFAADAPPAKDSAQSNPAVTPAPAAAPVAPAETATPAAEAAASAPSDSQPAKPAGTVLNAPNLTRLDVGGTVQLKAFYHNFAADRDADKSLSLNLRRLRLDFDGGAGDHFGFRGQFRLEGNGGNLGVDEGFLSWTCNDLFGIRGGKMKRPFSQEELMSSKSLYTVERGQLYQDFLESTTGYSGYDLGLLAYGGFEDEGVPVKYELGIFDGKQNDSPAKNYSNQQNEATDKGFRSKDVLFRLSASPFSMLKAEAGISTKTAEDTTNPDAFDLGVNTAYEVGLDFSAKHLRLLGELAWGDNHEGLDAKILAGSSFFVAFYGMGVWREDYSRGRASELVLKFEGLDPDARDDHPNDGQLRYTLGCNYFFTPTTSILGDYSILHPVTEVVGRKDLKHSLDVMWRMSF